MAPTRGSGTRLPLPPPFLPRQQQASNSLQGCASVNLFAQAAAAAAAAAADTPAVGQTGNGSQFGFGQDFDTQTRGELVAPW